MADVVGGIEWVQHNKGIWERPLGFLEFYIIAVQIVQVRLEATAVEVEEAGEVAAERLRVLLVEALEVRRHHQNQAVGAESSAVGHAQDGLIEYLLDDHHDRAKVFSSAY